jgi:tRNA pseudouridine55 synthase
LTEYLVDATKSYAARIELGVETNTYDADGEVLIRRDAGGISRDDLERVLSGFRGEFEQTPPAFSAIKREGTPLYKLARRGEAVTPEPRRVRVDRLDITTWDLPFLDVEMDCSKGFYVRSLAHDIGTRLGVGGTLTALVRTRVGRFRLTDAVGIETLAEAVEAGTWRQHLYAPDEVLLGWHAAILAEANAGRVIHGRTLDFEGTEAAPGELCRAYSREGDFLGVLASTGASQWRPAKVFVSRS